MSTYANALHRIRSGGGSVKVTIASNVGQGNAGTELKCAGCYVAAANGNTGHINMNIGAAATDELGIEIPEAEAGTPLFVSIDDVSKLYFYGATNGDIVHITYLTD